MYYQNKNINTLYKSRIDGFENTILLNTAKNAVTDGTSIYYQSSKDNKFYKMDFDGKNNTLVNSMDGNRYNFDGDYIYFSAYDSDWAVFKMRKDGTGATKIMDHTAADALLVSNGYIYCVSSVGGLYRASLDGSGNTLFVPKVNGFDLNIINDWMYYYTEDNLNYRVKTDRTGLQTF